MNYSHGRLCVCLLIFLIEVIKSIINACFTTRVTPIILNYLVSSQMIPKHLGTVRVLFKRPTLSIIQRFKSILVFRFLSNNRERVGFYLTKETSERVFRLISRMHKLSVIRSLREDAGVLFVRLR